MSKAKNASGRFAVAIMAAGKGTRLKSRHPKVLHEVAGKPLLAHVIAAAAQVVPAGDIYVIVGHEADRVRAAMESSGVRFVLQAEQRGTGHAMMVVEPQLRTYDHVLVLSGDVPLIRPQTITAVRDAHLASGAAMTVVSCVPPDPTGYGRVVRAKGEQNPEIAAIVEQKMLTPEQASIREINSGTYAFAAGPLYAHLKKLGTDNPHGEFYLTDMARVLRQAGEKVMASRSEFSETLGANTRAEMAELDRLLRLRKCEELMAAGATIFRPETCVIDMDVTVGPDTVIEPFVQLLGDTHVGSECRIRSFTVLMDSTVADGVLLQNGCVIESSSILSRASMGPYTHLRPGCEIGEGAHMGNFVEGKKLKMGKGSKANHLSYLGDTVVGEKVNVGAGTITCNYDGVHKYGTVIEDGAFIGSDATLVAPIKIGRGSYVAAASCVTEDVPADALAIARGRQANKEGWAKQRRETQAAAKKNT